VQTEGNTGNEPDPQQPTAPTGVERYAFSLPETAGSIEFKRVRRVATSDESRGLRQGGAHVRRSLRRRVLLPAAGLVVVLLVATGWVGVQGYSAAGHLRTAAGLFSQLQQQIQQADVTAAQGTLTALRAETDAAHDSTDGVGWAAASHLPFVGDDLGAVRTVSAVLDDLAVNGLPALLDVAAGLDPATLAPKGGRVDLTALRTAAPRIAVGLAVIRRSRATVSAIDSGGLTGQLAAAVTQLDDGLSRAERLITTADRAARLLPPMLGSEGPRTYLVLFQNLAEVRATGGLPGAYMVVRTDAGTVQIADQGTAASDLKVFDPPVVPLSEEQVGLYTTRPAVFPGNVNLTPDFPTAAMLARKMYQIRTGVAVDGVFAADPVVLSYLLRVTGPVAMPKGEPLTADNAVRLLLSDVYADYPDPKDQDAYFAGAARTVFEALLKGKGDPAGILTALGQAAGERRLLAWSANAEEEDILVGTVLAGRLPVKDGASPTVGVFLNDGSGGKLSYYLTQSATLSTGSCSGDGTRRLNLKLVLGSTAPAAGLPAYVTGLRLSGDPYTVRTNVMIFSPIDGAVDNAKLDGADIGIGTGMERERGVAVITVDLPPGTTRTLDVTIQTGDIPLVGGAVVPRLWTTPGVRPWKTSVTAGSACA
jgi:hypothetical protein